MDRQAGQHDIVLVGLNARYAHAAFGLRYLLANLGELRDRAGIVEFDISQRAADVVEAVLARRPRIVGIGVYIWNAALATEVAAMLKRLRPDIAIVLGGPEVSHETEQQEIFRWADYVVAGEGDLAFAALCRELLGGCRPVGKIISAEPLELSSIELPYDLYTDEDIAHRVIYVEASRGCPFRCEFCLSSLDVPLRNVPLERFLPAMQRLLDRGARRFKFVDRTFNLDVDVGRAILEFFLERYRPGMFLHFEMIPDRLPGELREVIERFPPGSLQFEVGIQTFHETAAALISRRQDNAKAEENLRYLRQHTGVHVHADLIAGLPGEDLSSFAAGFDRLLSLGPQEIQVGILTRLRGAPIARHDAEWDMVYSPQAPYEVLRTKLVNFATMQRIRRFARYWDMIANSGKFIETAPLIWRDRSPFAAFMALSDWLYEKTGRTHGIALNTLAELLFEHLGRACQAADALWKDYQRLGRRDVPEFLRDRLDRDGINPSRAAAAPGRQRRFTGPT